MENYLTKLDKYLSILPDEEREDILKELQSHIIELQNKEGKTVDTILTQLGDPRKLAKGYLAEYINDESKGSKSHKIIVGIKYVMLGFTSTLVVPILTLLFVVFYAAVPIILIAGLLKTLGSFIGLDFPFIMLNFGDWSMPAPFVFFACIPLALLMWLAGRGCWNLLQQYYKKVARTIHH